MNTHTFYKITSLAFITFFIVALGVGLGYSRLKAQEGSREVPQEMDFAVAAEERTEYYWNYGWPWFFRDYKTWDWSQYITEPRVDDIRCIFESVLRNEGNIPPYYHFIDINGDSLVDLMYYRSLGGSLGNHYAVLINKGDNNFETAYKCLTIGMGVPYKDGYYGDCANETAPTSTGCSFPGSYTSWPQSQTAKSDDYLRHALQFINNETEDTFAKYQFLDVNGDGLNDIFYGDYHKNEDNWSVQYSSAVFLNTGNNNFDLSYQCVEIHNSNNPENDIYYGDCAEI